MGPAMLIRWGTPCRTTMLGFDAATVGFGPVRRSDTWKSHSAVYQHTWNASRPIKILGQSLISQERWVLCFTIVGKRTQVYRCHESPSHLKKTKKTKEKRGPAFPRCLENKGIRIFFSYIMTKIKTEPTKGGMRCGGRSTFNLPPPFFSCEICYALLLLLLLCKPLSCRTSGDRRWFRWHFFLCHFFPPPP